HGVVSHIHDVLLLDLNVLSRTETREVPSNEGVEFESENVVVRLDERGHVLREGQLFEGSPAGENDIHHHENPLARRVDVNVARLVGGAEVGELQALTPD